MSTSPTLPYRPIAEQVVAARAGEYAAESEEQRFQRYARAAAVGRGVLEDFAARLGGVHEKEALNELLSCLIARSWELDDDARAARAAGSASRQRTFERSLGIATFRLELAGRVDESQPAEDASAPGVSS
jgi:hypothetical protein